MNKNKMNDNSEEKIYKKGLNPLNYKNNKPINYGFIKPYGNGSIDNFLDNWSKPKGFELPFTKNSLQTDDINNKKIIKPIEKNLLVLKNKKKKKIENKNILKTHDINKCNKKIIVKEKNNCLEINDIKGTQPYIKNNDYKYNYYHNNLRTDDINKKYFNNNKLLNQKEKQLNIKVYKKNKIGINDYFEKIRKVIKEEINIQNIKINKPKSLLIPKKRNC